VRLLLHGAAYFTELLAGIRALEAGDLLLFTDWRGDPDEWLGGPGTEVSRVLAEAAGRGVIVRCVPQPSSAATNVSTRHAPALTEPPT
jgi:hypothetical protein